MLQTKLQPFLDRYDEITKLLSSPDISNDIKQMTKLSKEQSSLEEVVNKSKEYIKICETIEENKILLEDSELGELAKEELKELEPKKLELEENIKFLMLPKDPNDDKNIYLEIRAGTGGDEAALFVADLLKAYIRYAENRGYKIEIISTSEGLFGLYACRPHTLVCCKLHHPL